MRPAVVGTSGTVAVVATLPANDEDVAPPPAAALEGGGGCVDGNACEVPRTASAQPFLDIGEVKWPRVTQKSTRQFTAANFFVEVFGFCETP